MRTIRRLVTIFTIAFLAIIFTALMKMYLEAAFTLVVDFYTWYIWVRYRQSIILVNWQTSPDLEHLFLPWYDRAATTTTHEHISCPMPKRFGQLTLFVPGQGHNGPGDWNKVCHIHNIGARSIKILDFVPFYVWMVLENSFLAFVFQIFCKTEKIKFDLKK